MYSIRLGGWAQGWHSTMLKARAGRRVRRGEEGAGEGAKGERG